MSDNDAQIGYRPVRATEDDQNRHEDDEEEARQDRELLPEEQCCCGAIQRLVSPVIFCALICLDSILLGAAFTGTGGGVFSTIEKRFQLKTSELAPFLMINDMVGMVIVLFVAYYGATSHRPRLIGGGTILVGVGLLISALPQFIYQTPPQFSLEIPRSENSTVDGLDGRNLIYPVLVIIAKLSSESLPYMTTGCNADCTCPTLYSPICDADGVTYVTPCHAGCPAMVQGVPGTDGGNYTTFIDCTCIGSPSQINQTGLSEDYDQEAISGQCPKECNTLIPFVAIMIVYAILGAIIGIPSFILEIRTVDEDDRSVAIGFSSMAMRLLAMIPSPIIYGAVIQSACLLLQSSCGKTGNCLIYDIVHFRYVFFGLTLGFEVLSTTMYIVCYCLIKDPKNVETTAALNGSHPKDSYDPRPIEDITLGAQEETNV